MMELEQRQAAGTECDKDEQKERVRVIYIERKRERRHVTGSLVAKRCPLLRFSADT